MILGHAQANLFSFDAILGFHGTFGNATPRLTEKGLPPLTKTAVSAGDDGVTAREVFPVENLKTRRAAVEPLSQIAEGLSLLHGKC